VRWAMLAVFAALPLQWFVVGSTPLGQARVHQMAILAFTAIVLVRYRARVHRPVLAISLPFVAANVCLLVIWMATSLYNGDRPFGPVQQGLYLAAYVAFATVIFRAALGLEPGLLAALRWAAVVATAALIGGLTYSMLANGVNPIQVFSETVATANPELLQRELFRTAFTGFGYDEEAVRGNIRHEVFGAILAAMYVSAWAARLRPLTSTGQRFVFNASLVVGSLLLLVSMSRAVLLAALAWPLLSFLRSAVTGRLSGRQVAVAFVAVAGTLIAVVSGFASVLWVRFTQDTSSYEARDDLLQQAYSNIADNVVTGGVETAGASSHNFILDTWLRSGVFGALAATVIVVVLIGLWASLIVRIGLEPEWMVPVAAALALPIVRLVTAGGGLIPPIQWVLLGFVAGAMAYRQALRSASDTEPDRWPDRAGVDRAETDRAGAKATDD
jgi:hypothetical protein